jgi:hypothetical protein
VNERPVRLIVSDDLRRGHGSVFFRVWFALPFLIWLALWAVAAFFVAILNWAVTLVMGRSHEPLHRFLARFVRCTIHVLAYLNLGAETLPSFDGKPGYPIDVEIDPPRRQNRWTVGFRIVLAVPALLLAGVLLGSGYNYYGAANPVLSLGLVGVAAFLGWFVALARGRMPQGLRDLIAYAISYGAQLWSYLLVLTDRYPSSDPFTAIGPLPIRDDPVQLEADDDLRRSRLTVFFRLLLALPHLIWLTLWGIAALLAAIVNWVATLFAGVSPQSLHRFLAAYVRYQLHVVAYLYLIGNPFPGFTGAGGSYPIELRVADRARQNRWSVLFRSVLALPALLIASVYGSLAFTVAVLGWFVALFTGRMPLGLRNAGALALRYGAQTNGYLLLVAGAYPYSGPCLAPPPAVPVPEPAALPPAV